MQIILSPHAHRQYKKLPPALQSVIKSTISELNSIPHPVNSKKLSGRPGYRLRYGNYRIIYEIDSNAKIITILAIAHRRDIYR